MVKTIHQTTHSDLPVSGGRRLVLDFRAEAESIPAVLLLPASAALAPGVLLLHGYSSRKEHLSDSAGVGLLRCGIASLAIDLPLHGTRASTVEWQAVRNPLEIGRLWRLASREAALAIRYLAARPEVDGSRLGLVGYSMGSFLGVGVAADDSHVRAVVLAAGGDLPTGMPLGRVARTLVDPLRAVRKLAGRPLLMIHGRRDGTVRPEQAERLFAAAGEPKEIRWLDAGHYLPPAAIDAAAEWLAARLSAA